METEGSDLERRIAGIAALNEPVRRALYLHVARAGSDVSRDQAAQALGISRALAAFHLDKLVEEGLLDVRFRRLTGRTGPGAGRPSKLYRRSNQEVQVTVPPRSYELAARLFARTLDSTTSPSVVALDQIAHNFGAQIGGQTLQAAGPEHDPDQVADAAEAALSAYGYEPFRDQSGDIRLRNCPFHALANEHRKLVCGMNLSLLEGLVGGLQATDMQAVLDPQPGMCCVTLRQLKR